MWLTIEHAAARFMGHLMGDSDHQHQQTTFANCDSTGYSQRLGFLRRILGNGGVLMSVCFGKRRRGGGNGGEGYQTTTVSICVGMLVVRILLQHHYQRVLRMNELLLDSA